MSPNNMSLIELYERAWSRGNYANAYESRELRPALATALAQIWADSPRGMSAIERQAITWGFTLGFYSSYEICELPLVDRELVRVAAEKALAYGWDPNGDELEELEVHDDQ